MTHAGLPVAYEQPSKRHVAASQLSNVRKADPYIPSRIKQTPLPNRAL